MRTDSHREGSLSLKTATGIADPVLLRLATARGVLVLLASDLTYDKAGAMRLHQVLWVRNRRALRELFTTNRKPLYGVQQELQLRQMAGHWMGTLHHQSIFRAPASRRGLIVANLSRTQYLAYRASSRQCLLAAAARLAPRRALFAQVLRALHQARFAVKRLAARSLLPAKLA